MSEKPTPPTDDEQFGDKMDALIPAPSEPAQDDHHVADELDVVLPAPSAGQDTADDASTREELETDTTVDGVDDIIDPNVADEAEDQEPINQDSGFYTSTYRAPAEPEPMVAAPEPEDEPTPDPSVDDANACQVCGKDSGLHAYCPHCGSARHPQAGLWKVVSPALSWSKAPIVRGTTLLGALIALVALLTDNIAGALVIAAVIAPVVIVQRLHLQLQPVSRVQLIAAAILALIGLGIGIPLAALAARIVKGSWFDTGILNYGAAGYGGSFASAAGSAPWNVWLVVGVLLPIVAIVSIAALAVVAKVALGLSGSERAGMYLAAAAAAGFVVGTAITFYRPLLDHAAPKMSSSEWTLTVVGMGVIRPIVLVISGAMIGAVAFRYMRTMDPGKVLASGLIAISIPLGFTLLSLVAQSSGMWAEFALGMAFAVATAWLYQRFLGVAKRSEPLA